MLSAAAKGQHVQTCLQEAACCSWNNVHTNAALLLL